MCEVLVGPTRAQGTGAALPRVHLGDLREARGMMLEDILTVQESDVFNELLWACDGTAWDTVGCVALRDAVFCLSNYYTIDRLNLLRGFSKSTWIERDEGELGMLDISTWCLPEVIVEPSQTKANCKDAMPNLSLPFPSAQCRRLARVMNRSAQDNPTWALLFAALAALSALAFYQ